MSSKMFDQFETDPQREKDGVWLDYGSYQVRVARAGGANKDYQKALERVSKKYRHSLKHDTMDADQQEEILRRVYAQYVILDWKTKVEEGGDKEGFKKGIEQKDSDKLLPVNRENVLATLKALPGLFEDIREQATTHALWRAALKDEISGNL